MMARTLSPLTILMGASNTELTAQTAVIQGPWVFPCYEFCQVPVGPVSGMMMRTESSGVARLGLLHF